MLLKDITNGPVWLLWIVFAVIAAMSVLLLTGRGAWLIAGYNTASKEEKSRYDEKKLCRLTGAVTLVISLLVLVLAAGGEVLPAWVAYVFVGAVVLVCAVMAILVNRVCKRK